ncbi:hypothetical protein [Beijerinckia sp. L45]|uniref:bestrophin-like domain n=1 Tax=Beijerinckia sp. L45 TaxID=1641855 RepID=UPI00131ABEE1|nr:hypothetical protein [Beijerinckia sp. L45]
MARFDGDVPQRFTVSDLGDLFSSIVVLVLLIASVTCGRLMIRWLPEQHRTRTTFQFTELVSNLLVTFTALILGLLTASVNASFEKAETDLRSFGSQIIRLTNGLDEAGAPTLPIRVMLRTYTASAIATTWPEEPAPDGVYPKVSGKQAIESEALGRLLAQVEHNLRRLPAADDLQRGLKSDCITRLNDLLNQRWRLIGEAHSTIPMPFYWMMLFWLVVVFLSFGMSAPRNWVSTAYVVMVALCIAGAVFVILELDGPLDGVIKVSSAPLRDALHHLDVSVASLPVAD